MVEFVQQPVGYVVVAGLPCQSRCLRLLQSHYNPIAQLRRETGRPKSHGFHSVRVLRDNYRAGPLGLCLFVVTTRTVAVPKGMNTSKLPIASARAGA